MGCTYSKENRCHSVSCCFYKTGNASCYWIAAVSFLWESFGQCFDYIITNSEFEYCEYCIEHVLNTKLSFASGIISSIQVLASILLIIGVKMNVRVLVILWLIWSSVNLVMILVWIVYSMPHMPNMRGIASIIKLIWAVHYLIVVKTHYTKMILTFSPMEEGHDKVPPNTPSRPHKRRKQRLNPDHQPIIRTLLAAALELQGLDGYIKHVTPRTRSTKVRRISGRRKVISNKRKIRRKRRDLKEQRRAERDRNAMSTRDIAKEDEQPSTSTGKSHENPSYVVMDIEHEGDDSIVTLSPSGSSVEYKTRERSVPNTSSNDAINEIRDTNSGNRIGVIESSAICLMPGGPPTLSPSPTLSDKKVRWKDEVTYDDDDQLIPKKHRSQEDSEIIEVRVPTPDDLSQGLMPDDLSQGPTPDDPSQAQLKSSEAPNSDVKFRTSKDKLVSRRKSYKNAVGHDDVDSREDDDDFVFID